MLVKCLQNRGNVQNLQTLSAKQVYTLKKKKKTSLKHRLKHSLYMTLLVAGILCKIIFCMIV